MCSSEKKIKRVLVDVFIIKITPENLIGGIRKGCRRLSCLKEVFNKDESKNKFLCDECGYELSYFYNFDLFLQINPNCLEIIKVNLNTLKELEGDGLIGIDANIANRDPSLLVKIVNELISPFVKHTLCIELPSWKVIGKYSSNSIN